MAIKCDICGEKKPFLFSDFIQCKNCERTFCPRCAKEFKNMGGYPPKLEMNKCPECKSVGFHRI